MKQVSLRSACIIFANGKAVAIYEKSAMNGEHILYIHRDHLGSVMAYTDENRNIAEELSYDAWGRRRNPDTWACYEYSNSSAATYDNGFTGNEHIDMFDMINMDGRMYDPVVELRSGGFAIRPHLVS